MKKALLFVVFTSVSFLGLYSQTYDFTATGPGNWENAGVWDVVNVDVLNGNCDTAASFLINNDITRNGDIYLEGDLLIDTASMYIQNGFRVNGDLNTSYPSFVEVIDDTLFINGNLNVFGGVFIVDTGAIVVITENVDLDIQGLFVYGDMIVLGDMIGQISLTGVYGNLVVVGDVDLENIFLDPLYVEGNAYFFADTFSISPDDLIGNDPLPEDSLPRPGLGDYVYDLINQYLVSIAPESASANIETYCFGDEATVTLSYSGGKLGSTASARWYANPECSGLVGVGQDIEIAAPTTDSTFYVRFEGYDTTSTASVTINVIQDIDVAGTITGASEVCPGATSVTYSVSTISYADEYVWSYSGTGATITGLTDTVTVDFSSEATDGYLTVYGRNSCFTGGVSPNYSITVNALPTATISGPDSICIGSSAILSVGFTGEAPWEFTYQRNGANDSTISNILTSPFNYEVSDTGTYRILYVADNNCSATTSTETKVSYYTVPEAIISGDNTICDDGVSTSTVTIELEGMAPWDITYQRDGSNDSTVTGITESPYTFEVMETGAYTVLSVSDANCMGSVAGSATISYFIDPTATISGNNTICDDETSTATITVAFTGTAPWDYTYQRDGGNDSTVTGISESPYTFEVMEAGTYTVLSVSDANCMGSGSGSATISYFIDPTATISGDNTICDDETGTATITVAFTGTAPWDFTYQRDGENDVTVENISESPYTFNVMEAGVYTISALNDANCTGEGSGAATISYFTDPTASISGDNTICNDGVTTAKITVGFEGTAPWAFTYQRDGVENVTVNDILSTPYTFDVMGAGVYTISSVSDANCTGIGTGSATISYFTDPTAEISGGGTICPGSTSKLEVTLEGTAPWSIIYQRNGANDVEHSDITDSHFVVDVSEAGTYTLLEVSDANCSGSVSGQAEVNVLPGVPDKPGAISGIDAVCPGEQGAMYSIGTVDNASYYNWFYSGAGATLTVAGASVTVDYGIDATNGQVSVTAVNICGESEISDGFDVSVKPLPEFDNPGTLEACDWVILPEITGTNLSGSQAYYLETGGSGVVYNSGGKIAESSLVYIYDVTNGCANETYFNVVVNKADVDLGSDIEICKGEGHTFAVSSDHLDVEWHDGSRLYEYTGAATEKIWVDITDRNNCTGSDTVLLTVYDNPVIDLGPDTAICGESTYMLSVEGSFDEYDWSTGDITPTITIYSGEQTITLIVTDMYGCVGADEISILGCTGLTADKVTNVFTPNGDHINDTWKIEDISDYPDAKVEVFDRWGRRVFLSENGYANDWEGTFNGKQLPYDNYYFVIDLYNDGKEILHGNLTIIK